MLEVVEGREADAEVIEGEPAADLFECNGEYLGSIRIRDRGRFGNLERELLRVDALFG